ncbi:MAG: hypothetical protein KAR16_05950 [Bacteroidales bacterium]|nr:hypothetical protein [Bacteroidales bacterium]
MKKVCLILSIIAITLPTFTQENKYQEAMTSTIEALDNASGPDEYLECANRFERIASAEKTLWMPYYYASYSLVVMSFDEADGEKKDQVLDRAQELLDAALKLEPEESELHVLQAFLYPSRILVDPMGRGMMYMEKMFGSLETAKALNPDNPRIYFLEGVNKVNLPPSMGGGIELAKPILEKAIAKFEAFNSNDPFWPNWGEEAAKAELDKLQ